MHKASVTCVTPRWFDGSLGKSFRLVATRKPQDCGARPFHTRKEVLPKKTNLRKSIIFAVLIFSVVTCAYALPQSGTETSQPAAQSAGKIGPSAVWRPPSDFITKAHAACDQSNPPNYAECFIDQMAKLGAPAGAVSFTRMLYKQSDGQVGIMTEFHQVGPVDEARVMYPLRANDNYGLLLVNGQPAILDMDDLKKLDRAAMEQNLLYQSVRQKYPKTDLWPGDRSGNAWPQTNRLPDGGLKFIVGYPLLNGCHACATTGLAKFSWDFDAKGKFLGTKYITSPPPKPMRPNRAPQPPPSAQQPPQ
jgi:hypothetical protein